MGQRPCCSGLEVVVFLGVGGVHGPGLLAGCEQLQLDNVFGQAGVSGRLVVLGQDVFVSHSGDPSRVEVFSHCSPGSCGTWVKLAPRMTVIRVPALLRQAVS